MTRDIHDIPPAPRHAVRWSAALWHRWPLALAAFLLGVYGGLWTLMLWFAASGKPRDDARLDAGAQVAVGETLAVAPTSGQWRGAPAERVEYHFAHGGADLHGASFAGPGHAVGAAIRIEFVQGAPHINRVEGGRIQLLPDFVTPALFATIVPGAVLAMVWLAGVLRTRRLLVDGDVAVATITGMRALRFVLPPMLAVEFTFRDRHAETRSGRQWVRARSSLGQRLLRRPSAVAVVHDRAHPTRHRLVVAEEFAAAVRARPSGSLDARA